jgi:glycerophosphoryl diester phosphodiesterase
MQKTCWRWIRLTGCTLRICNGNDRKSAGAKTVWVIAHRGASGSAPENTLVAFRRAVELGAGFIETDLQLSRDTRLVALHDPTLERTTNGIGEVSSATLAELRELDAGGWFRGVSHQPGGFSGEPIPTLEEVLAFGQEKDIGLFLEIKAPGASGAEQTLVGALHDADAVGRTVVLSFDPGILAKVRRLDPLIVAGYLYEKSLANAVAEAVAAGARQILPRGDRITANLVEEAHRNDLKIVAWTVNAREKMKELIDLGVDGIITDYPQELVSLLAG